MRYLFVFNKIEREKLIFDRIAGWLRKFQPSCSIMAEEYCLPELIDKAILFSPDVLITYPPTARGTSDVNYIIKYFCNCAIVTIETEGIVGYYPREIFLNAVDHEQYSSVLIDYALFWGDVGADYVGARLLQKHKLSGHDRIKVFGHVEYEPYFEKETPEWSRSSRNLRERFESYSPDRRLLFLTGFQGADYTQQDIINAGDIVDMKSKNFKEELRQVVSMFNFGKELRMRWIDAILQLSQAYEDTLFVVKLHPVEMNIHKRKQIDPYVSLRGKRNILVVDDPDIKIANLLPHCNVLVHYGSTAVVESYLLNIPSIYVHIQEYSTQDFGYLKENSFDTRRLPATYVTLIEDLPEVVGDFLSRSWASYVLPEQCGRVMRDFLNMEPGQEYVPSQGIARFLTTCKAGAQPLPSGDPGLLSTLQRPSGERARIVILNAFISAVLHGKFAFAEELLRRISDCAKLLTGEAAKQNAMLIRRSAQILISRIAPATQPSSDLVFAIKLARKLAQLGSVGAKVQFEDL